MKNYNFFPKMLVRKWVCLSLVFFGGCKTTSSETSAIIGKDDRRKTTDLSQWIGSFNVNGKPVCTAFVSGPNQLTTTAHCLSEEEGVYSFTRNLDKKEFKVLDVIYVNLLSDIAILKVSVGDSYLKSAKYQPGKSIAIISFDTTQRSLVMNKTTSIDEDHTFLFHGLDSIPGASGSPLLAGPEVVGMHIGALPSRRNNLAIKILMSDVAPTYLFTRDLESEGFGIKIPKKIGGSLGHAIGQVTNPIRDNVTRPIADAVNSVPCDSIGFSGGFSYTAASEVMANRNPAKEALSDNQKNALRGEFGDLVDKVQIHYSAIPMDSFKFSVPIGKIITWSPGSDGQTFGYEIYIHGPKGSTNLGLLAHEMVHSVQYRNRGENLLQFGQAYFRGWCDVSFDYDKNQMEKDAREVGKKFE